MYNFKTVDYRLSRQEYIFSLISMKDENKLNFVYIPYSEFPALVMLDHILATNPNKFNADLFEYFKEIGKDERLGNESILILSEKLTNKYSYMNKLGIYNKDYYSTEMHLINNSGKRLKEVKGKNLEILGGLGDYRQYILAEVDNASLEGIDSEYINLQGLTRSNDYKALLFEENSVVGIRDTFKSSYLIGVGLLDSELRSSTIEYYVRFNRVDYTSTSIHEVLNIDGAGRYIEFIKDLQYRRFNESKIKISDRLFGDTLSQHKGITVNIEKYFRDFRVFDWNRLVGSRKEIKLKGDIKYLSIGVRDSYIKYGEVLDSKVFQIRGNTFNGLLIYIKDLKKESITEIANLDLYENEKDFLKPTMTSLGIKDIGKDSILGEFVLLDKDSDSEVKLEYLVNVSDDMERLVRLSSILHGGKDFEQKVEFIPLQLFSIIQDKNALIIGDTFASKDNIEKSRLEYVLRGTSEGMGVGHIQFIYEVSRKYNYEGVLLFANNLIDYEDNVDLNNYLIHGNLFNEREIILEQFQMGDKYKGRDSILFQSIIAADKEKNVDLIFTTHWEKDGETVCLHHLKTYVRDQSLESLIKYDANYIIEQWGEGVLQYLATSTKELSHNAIIDINTLYSDFSVEKYGLILEGKFTDYRDIRGKGLITNEVFTGINTYREGVQESPIYAVMPRKKLIKSWLGDFERDKKKDVVIDSNAVGTRYKVKRVAKNSLYESKRFYKKEVSFNSLEEVEIERKNRLNKDALGVESIKPITKSLDKRTTTEKGFRYKIKPLLKFDLNALDYEKDAVIEYSEYFDKTKDAFISEQISSQSLLYNYFDILEEGMDVEHWKVGYAIPEDYDPLDPFNPYYPWAEERNTHSIIQEERWEQTQGEWELDKGNAVINGSGLLTTEEPYGDFKFKFNTRLGYEPDCRSGFVFKYDDIDNYYKITLSPGNNSIDLVQLIGGRERRLATPIAPFFMDVGSVHNLDISLVDNRLVIYVDGRLQYDLQLES